MKITIDTDAGTLKVAEGGAGDERTLPLWSDAAFDLVSQAWKLVGWNQKYSYGFTWLGRPVIQLPEDMLRIQEVIHTVRPDVIIETGVAHGGSLIFYASLCHAMGKGRVVGIDIEIRPHNRAAIEAHPMAGYISLIEGSSTAAETVAAAKAHIKAGESVLVLLDSNHSYAHVADELVCYAPLVTSGSYIVVTDGVMRELAEVPAGDPSWVTDNPANAAEDFAAGNADFVLEPPARLFNEGTWEGFITYWPSAWLRRR